MMDWNVDEFLKNEDELHHKLMEKIELHVPSLIIASEGYCDQEVELKMEQDLRMLFEDHVAILESLRCLLVYENIRNLKLTCKKIKEETALEVLQDCLVKAKKSYSAGRDMRWLLLFLYPKDFLHYFWQIFKFLYNRQLEKDLEMRISSFELTQSEHEMENVIEAIGQNVVKQVDERFSWLVEAKNLAKVF